MGNVEVASGADADADAQADAESRAKAAALLGALVTVVEDLKPSPLMPDPVAATRGHRQLLDAIARGADPGGELWNLMVSDRLARSTTLLRPSSAEPPPLQLCDVVAPAVMAAAAMLAWFAYPVQSLTSCSIGGVIATVNAHLAEAQGAMDRFAVVVADLDAGA